LSQARILLVEDEFLVRLIVAEALIDAGFRVVEADQGGEALRMLDGSSGFELMITDVQMPGHPDVIGVARHARARFPAMPIIFTTARPDSIRAFTERGERDAIVQKPYGPEQMLGVIRGVLGASPSRP
jgi:CheY-like chemotaxis protein